MHSMQPEYIELQTDSEVTINSIYLLRPQATASYAS